LLAFISHGGANSITEASYVGKPLIVLPLFGDQNRNALMIEERGMGLQLDKTDLTKEKIVAAIRKIVYEPHYMQKAKELSEIIRNKPMNPDDRLIRHVEFAAKYDVHSALDLHGRYLSTIEYYNLDIIGLVASCFLLGIGVFFYAARFIVRKCCGKKSKSAYKSE
jgi:UDP-N-acetylglucosamine transferase subunit ALG13